MTTANAATSVPREPELLGQTVVVIGGSAGMGFETARHARSEGADVVLTGRDPDRLEHAALELAARSSAAFDVNDAAALGQFFADLPTPIDHVMLTGPGPRYAPPLQMDAEEARAAISALELAPIRVNLVAAGFVDTPLSASLLGNDLERRREELRAKLPVGRVIGPADIAALAVHLMTNTAITGATYDIDGGQQLVE
jgi:NAD(P)-dependent dehydrogenase (short-subunit alcohol dehydrogenase family)